MSRNLRIAWASGHLSVRTLKRTRTTHATTIIGTPPENQEKPKSEVVLQEQYWYLDGGDGCDFALVASSEYFVSGVNRFPELVGSVINMISLPVRSLLRVFSAQSQINEWISVPLAIWEDGINGQH